MFPLCFTCIVTGCSEKIVVYQEAQITAEVSDKSPKRHFHFSLSCEECQLF